MAGAQVSRDTGHCSWPLNLGIGAALAWEGWQDATETSPTRAYCEEADSAFFERGFITNLLNPKAAIFYIAVLPEFIESEKSVLWQTGTLFVVYVSIATDARHCRLARRLGAAVSKIRIATAAYGEPTR